jgi:hypothetical protein
MTIVSHHLLRRRARAKANALNNTLHPLEPRYRVVQAQRGPWRWYVVGGH